MSQRVLFFFNNLNRTGSETMLFNFICELNKTQEVKIGIVIMDSGGDLVAEIPENIPVFYLNTAFNLFDKLSFQLGIDVLGNRLKNIQKQFKADIWYFNTIANIGLLRYKKAEGVRAWVHVHELLYSFETIKPEEVHTLLNHCDHLIACSKLVGDIFLPIFNKPITIINSSVNRESIVKFASPDKKNSDKTKIVASGTICYVKGTDIFLEVANLLPAEKFEFIWLGKFAKNGFAEIIKEKNKKFKRVTFLSTENTEEYISNLSQADMFVSTSRSESMGLVLHEAAVLKIPILSLNCGGAELIVNESNGLICYDERPEEIVKQILELSNRLDDFVNYPELPFDFHLEMVKFTSLFNK